MNILCNPTGKKGHFRPIDWVIEHNNLYIKVSSYWLAITGVEISVSGFMEENSQTIRRIES